MVLEALRRWTQVAEYRARAMERARDPCVLWFRAQSAKAAESVAQAAAAKEWSAWAFPCLAMGTIAGLALFILCVGVILSAMAPFFSVALLFQGLRWLCERAPRHMGWLVGAHGRQVVRLLYAGSIWLMQSALRYISTAAMIVSGAWACAAMGGMARRFWSLRPDLAPSSARAWGLNLFCFQSLDTALPNAWERRGIKHIEEHGDGLDRVRSLGYENLVDPSVVVQANHPIGFWGMASMDGLAWETPLERIERHLSINFLGKTAREQHWLDWARALGEGESLWGSSNRVGQEHRAQARRL
jgi:hypothetical protein